MPECGNGSRRENYALNRRKSRRKRRSISENDLNAGAEREGIRVWHLYRASSIAFLRHPGTQIVFAGIISTLPENWSGEGDFV
jgi:hypothetical protein